MDLTFARNGRSLSAGRGLIATLVSFVVVLPAVAIASPLSPVETARQIDQLLAGETRQGSAGGDASTARAVPARADDETYLRRVHLDLVGELPGPQELTAFVLDSSPGKRLEVVDRLLADPRYGRNWARYWRDVLLYRRNDPRALLAAQSVVEYLAQQFNRGASWKQIAQSLITAKGSLRENGATGLLAAQWGETADTASEVSRILMGVQIQCAQCHDHKTDRWKREQFHEFAAFFPRLAIRRVEREGKRVDFAIVSKDSLGGPKQKKPKPNQKPLRRFEHYMPDLENPAAEGTLMKPVFFLTGQKLDIGVSDNQRRQMLAEWITSADNPWFARAVVNRIWAELIGEGFYEPVDDLGPDKTCSAPKTMELLAGQFVAHDYDLKWLLRTITATDLYGRQTRPRRNADQTPFETVCPQPLRADQLFNNLVFALGVEDRLPEDGLKANAGAAAARFLNTPRGRFVAAFGFDPSAPRDELSGSIDQALLMMNTAALARAIEARAAGNGPPTLLGNLLAERRSDDQIVLELYLRCLAREPKPGEVRVCRDYLNQVKDRREAMEDILWALVNSTEFLYRH
jgi:hypothetical protein